MVNAGGAQTINQNLAGAGSIAFRQFDDGIIHSRIRTTGAKLVSLLNNRDTLLIPSEAKVGAGQIEHNQLFAG